MEDTDPDIYLLSLPGINAPHSNVTYSLEGTPDIWSLTKAIHHCYDSPKQLCFSLNILAEFMSLLVESKKPTPSGLTTLSEEIEIIAIVEVLVSVLEKCINSLKTSNQCVSPDKEQPVVTAVNSYQQSCYYTCEVIAVVLHILQDASVYYQQYRPLTLNLLLESWDSQYVRQQSEIEKKNNSLAIFLQQYTTKDIEGIAVLLEKCRSIEDVITALNIRHHLPIHSHSNGRTHSIDPAGDSSTLRASVVKSSPLKTKHNERFWMQLINGVELGLICFSLLTDFCTSGWQRKLPLNNNETTTNVCDFALLQQKSVIAVLTSLSNISAFIRQFMAYVFALPILEEGNIYKPVTNQLRKIGRIIRKSMVKCIIPDSSIFNSHFGLSSECLNFLIGPLEILLQLLTYLRVEIDVPLMSSIENSFAAQEILIVGTLPLFSCLENNVEFLLLHSKTAEAIIGGLCLVSYVLRLFTPIHLAHSKQDISRIKNTGVDSNTSHYSFNSFLWNHCGGGAPLIRTCNDMCNLLPDIPTVSFGMHLIFSCLLYVRKCTIIPHLRGNQCVGSSDANSDLLNSTLEVESTLSGTHEPISDLRLQPAKIDNDDHDHAIINEKKTIPTVIWENHICYTDGIPVAIQILQLLLSIYLPSPDKMTDEMFHILYLLQRVLIEEAATSGDLPEPFGQFRSVLLGHLETILGT